METITLVIKGVSLNISVNEWALFKSPYRKVDVNIEVKSAQPDELTVNLVKAIKDK